jgi:hypothetical protein
MLSMFAEPRLGAQLLLEGRLDILQRGLLQVSAGVFTRKTSLRCCTAQHMKGFNEALFRLQCAHKARSLLSLRLLRSFY